MVRGPKVRALARRKPNLTPRMCCAIFVLSCFSTDNDNVASCKWFQQWQVASSIPNWATHVPCSICHAYALACSDYCIDFVFGLQHVSASLFAHTFRDVSSSMSARLVQELNELLFVFPQLPFWFKARGGPVGDEVVKRFGTT